MRKGEILPNGFMQENPNLLPTGFDQLETPRPVYAINSKVLALTRTRGVSFGELKDEKYGTATVLGLSNPIDPTLVPRLARPYLVPEDSDIATGSLYKIRVQAIWGPDHAVWRPSEALFFCMSPIETDLYDDKSVRSQLRVVRYSLEPGGLRLDETHLVHKDDPVGEARYTQIGETVQYYTQEDELRAINTAINTVWLRETPTDLADIELQA